MDKHLDAEALSDYAEGLPDAQARSAADAHLAGCAQCRAELAAIQAYFRNLADLEPARAPADFLSRVRARLPRPSPWEKAWAALLIPFRFVPVPIAVGVILGVTAITVYLFQGGPETRTLIPAPEARPAPVSRRAAPEAGPAPALSQPASKDISPMEAESVPAAPAAAPARQLKTLSGKPREARVRSASPRPAPPSAAKKEAAVPPPMAPKSEPGGGAAGASGKLRDVEVEGWSDKPSSVYIQDNSSAPADLPLDKTMPVEEQDAVPGQAEAAAGHAAAKRKAEEKNQEAGYVLILRAAADTASVLAGLRSMGVKVESESHSPGESALSPGERPLRLIVPAPMLSELGPYLARHGESRLEGRLPSAASGSVVSIRLRLIFPVR